MTVHRGFRESLHCLVITTIKLYGYLTALTTLLFSPILIQVATESSYTKWKLSLDWHNPYQDRFSITHRQKLDCPYTILILMVLVLIRPNRIKYFKFTHTCTEYWPTGVSVSCSKERQALNNTVTTLGAYMVAMSMTNVYSISKQSHNCPGWMPNKSPCDSLFLIHSTYNTAHNTQWTASSQPRLLYVITLLAGYN